MAEIWFTQYQFLYNNSSTSSISVFSNNGENPIRYNDGSLVRSKTSEYYGCHFYTKNGSIRTVYMIAFFKQSSLSNMPPRTAYQVDEPWQLLNTVTGSYGNLVYSGETYTYVQVKTHTYDESTGYYYSVSPTPFRLYEFAPKNNVNRYLELGEVSAIDDTMRLMCLDTMINEAPYGQGAVTLSIKKPGQTLNFVSRLLGKTLSQYISSNATINMDVPINIKKITQLPAQSRTDTHLDGWHGEYVAKYTVNTANAVLAIMKIATNEYTNLRFYTPYTSTKVHSSEYKLRSTGANISQSSNTPYDIEVRGFEDNRSHAEFTYVTNITLIEVQSSETVLYETSRSGGVSDQSPLSSGDLSLTSGKYVLLAGGNRYADTTNKDCWIENSNGQSLFKGVEYDPYGHSRSIVFGIVNVAESETFKAYFRVSNSAQGDCSLSAIKLPNDSTVYSANGTGTATSTLSEVCSLSLSVGRYIVVIQTAFDTNSGCKISHQADLGSETIIEENSADTTVYKPVLNSIGYVNVFSAGRVVVSVKATATVSVDSKIVAVKI